MVSLIKRRSGVCPPKVPSAERVTVASPIALSKAVKNSAELDGIQIPALPSRVEQRFPSIP